MDKKAKDILFKTYWSSKGWKMGKECYTDPDDFAYAKEKGFMFDPFTISHDDCVKRIIEIRDTITLDQVTKAFLSSLSTRRLDWRSGIASYYVAKHIIPHKYTPVESGHSYNMDGEIVHTSYTCKVCEKCGVVGNESYANEDLNVLNFERLKWGGVRHGRLLYTLFDLDQFRKEQISKPVKMDIEILKNFLIAIRSCDSRDYPSKLRDKLKDIPNFKSNKSERDTMIEILACIGVLKPMSCDRPIRGDWNYAAYWRGEDGYDAEMVEIYWGKYLKEID